MSSLFYQSHTNDDYEYDDEYNDDNMYDYQNNIADDSDEGNNSDKQTYKPIVFYYFFQLFFYRY